MADETNGPVLYTCAVSGEQSPGKHYLLSTTEGQELVSPEALFHNGADRRLAVMLVELQQRVGELEKRLEPADPDQDAGEDQEDEHQAAAEKKAPAKRAPAKKTAAKSATKAGD